MTHTDRMEQDVESACNAALALYTRSPQAFAAVLMAFERAFESVETRRQNPFYMLGQESVDAEIEIATAAAISAHALWKTYRVRDQDLTGNERALAKFFDRQIEQQISNIADKVRDDWFPDEDEREDDRLRGVGAL